MKYLFIKYPLFFDTRMFTTRNTCAAAPPPRRRRRCRVTPKFDSVDCRVTDFIVSNEIVEGYMKYESIFLNKEPGRPMRYPRD